MDTKDLRAELARLASTADGRVKAVELDHEQLRERIEELESRATPARTGGGRAATREQKAYDTFLRCGRDDELRALYTKEMSIAGGAANGQGFVPELISSDLNKKALDNGPIASRVKRSKSSTSDYVSLLSLNGQAASWSSETGTRSETASLQMREVRPTGGELFSVIPVTRWLLEDSKFDVAQLIAESYVEQASRALETAVLVGTGSSQLTGMLHTAPSTMTDDGSPTRAQDVYQYIDDSSDHASDLVRLFFTLKAPYRKNAEFAMSSATLSAIRQLRAAGGDGAFLWQQNLASAVDAADGFLLGKKVCTCENFGLIDSSPEPYSIACGDWKRAFEIVEVGPLSVVRDDVTVRGKVIFYLAQRWYGRPLDNDAVKFLKG